LRLKPEREDFLFWLAVCEWGVFFVVLFGQAKRTHPIKRGCARLEKKQIKETGI
jgi:hypothetical protein